jgi:glyoxylate utilization-related uncharacterized protein
MSRMLLWCRASEGNVTVNGRTGILRPGDMMFMPWGHRIRYFNGSKDPWRISGIHSGTFHQGRSDRTAVQGDIWTAAAGKFRSDNSSMI